MAQKEAPKSVENILEAIRQAESILVVGHIRPDGDCIGSQLGLALALEGHRSESPELARTRRAPGRALRPRGRGARDLLRCSRN